MLLFLLEADCANQFSSRKTLTCLALLLTPLNFGYKNCHYFKFLHLLLRRTISQQFINSAFLRVLLVSVISLECISEVFTPPAVFNPLSVSIQKPGKNAWHWIFFMSTSISLSPNSDAKTYPLPGKCWTLGISCFPLIWNPATTTLRFFQGIGNISPFLGLFHPFSLDIFISKSCPLASVPRPIYLPKF